MNEALEISDIDKIFERSDIFEIFFNNSGLNGAVNNQGHFVYLSTSWKEDLGWTIEELKEKTFFDFIHPEDLEKSKKAYQTNDEYLKKNPQGFINRYLHKDGSYVHLYWKPWQFEVNGLKLFSAEAIHNIEIAEIINSSINEGKTI